jgi:NAD(P)-dependent dehydrogenase (short-subunit alcohol dehydrogenase family)
MMKNLNQPLAIITGGGTGIGRAVGEALLAAGYRCIALGLDKDSDLPSEINFYNVDISDTKLCISRIPDDPVTALINCAGVLRHDDEWQAEAFDFVMKINVTAAFALANAMIDKLEEGRGSVGNIWIAGRSSIYGI